MTVITIQQIGPGDYEAAAHDADGAEIQPARHYVNIASAISLLARELAHARVLTIRYGARGAHVNAPPHFAADIKKADVLAELLCALHIAGPMQNP